MTRYASEVFQEVNMRKKRMEKRSPDIDNFIKVDPEKKISGYIHKVDYKINANTEKMKYEVRISMGSTILYDLKMPKNTYDGVIMSDDDIQKYALRIAKLLTEHYEKFGYTCVTNYNLPGISVITISWNDPVPVDDDNEEDKLL